MSVFYLKITSNTKYGKFLAWSTVEMPKFKAKLPLGQFIPLEQRVTFEIDRIMLYCEVTQVHVGKRAHGKETDAH